MFLPIYSLFFILFSGYIAKRIGLIPQNQSIIFIDFVIAVALPAMVFNTIYHVQINTELIFIMILGLASTVIGAILATFLAYVLKFNKTTIVCICLLAMFGNTIFVGLPIVQGFLGDAVTNKIILYDQFTTSIPLAITAPFILSFADANSPKITQIIKKVIRFPPFIALISALLLKNIPIPHFVFEPLKILSNSVTPVALFAVGLGLSFKGIKRAWKGSLIVILGKMILPPLLYILTIEILGISLNKDWLIGALLCSMPPMVSTVAMVMKARLDATLAVSSITLGLVFTALISPLIFFILR